MQTTPVTCKQLSPQNRLNDGPLPLVLAGEIKQSCSTSQLIKKKQSKRVQPPTSHHPLLVTAVNTVGDPQSILRSVSQLEAPPPPPLPHRGAGLYLSSFQLLLSYLVKADKVHLTTSPATSLATGFHDLLIIKCICRVKSSS